MTELGLQHGTLEAWAGKWWNAGYSSILIRLFIHFGFVDTNRTSGEQIYRNIQYPPGTHKQRRCVSHSLFSPLLWCNYSLAGCFTESPGLDDTLLAYECWRASWLPLVLHVNLGCHVSTLSRYSLWIMTEFAIAGTAPWQLLKSQTLDISPNLAKRVNLSCSSS